MISFLRGKILEKRKNFIILDVRDVGYKIFLHDGVLSELEKNNILEIFIYEHIREDSYSLYGFRRIEELDFFELLLSISGIGPKSALACLGVASLEDLKGSIAAGEASLISQTPGIGKKTAEKVILELRDKIDHIEVNQIGVQQSQNNYSRLVEEIEALVNLGYSMLEAKDVLQSIDPEISESSERIRAALKKLSK